MKGSGFALMTGKDLSGNVLWNFINQITDFLQDTVTTTITFLLIIVL